MAARNGGGSCGSGARDALESRVISNAVSHLVAGARTLLEEDKSPAHTGRHSFAPAVAACALSFPCSTAVIGVSLRTAAMLARWSGVFSVNNADNPEATNGVDNAKGADSEGRTRGLPPEGIKPPAGEVKEGPASRPSEQDKGGKSLWDSSGGEWRYSPEDKWHNPHWDYNPHDKPSSPWQNVPIDRLPPRK
jgi:hypothetical protein